MAGQHAVCCKLVLLAEADSVNVFAQIESDMSVKLQGMAKENSVLCADAITTTAAGCPVLAEYSLAGVPSFSPVLGAGSRCSISQTMWSNMTAAKV